MNRITRFGAALVAAGIVTTGAAVAVGATPSWPHDQPSCSLLPTTVGVDTVILTNANHAPRHLQLWEDGRIVYNQELPVGGAVRAARDGYLMWAGHQYHVSDYEGVRWCQAEPTTTTTEPEETTTTTEPEGTTTSTTEPPGTTTSTTEPPASTTSTTEPEGTTTSTTEPPAPTTSEPEPTTSTTAATTSAPPTTGTTVVQAQVLTGQAQGNGNVDPDGNPVDRLPHTGRDTGPIVALGTLLLAAGTALVAHARRVAAR